MISDTATPETKLAAGKTFHVPWSVRLIGSALVLTITFWLLPTRDVFRTIRDIPPRLWLFAFGVFLLGHIVLAAKWWVLTSGGDIIFTDALRAHFAGFIANLCLPGAAGGDVVRAGLIVRKSVNKSRIAVGSIADRIIDTIGLFILSCFGALFVVERGAWSESPLFRVGILFVGGLSALFVMIVVIAKLPKKGVVEKLSSAAAEFRKEPRKLVLCLGLSILVQAVFIGLNIAFATASGVRVSAAAWFFAWPLAKLIATLPVSMGGLGVREASLAGLLTRFGAVPAKVVAVGLLWQTILYASSLVGALALFMISKVKAFSLSGSQPV